MRRPALALSLTLPIVALAGCAAPAPEPDDGRISVVASTNVYGDIAARVGGDLVEVTSIVTGAAQDPHSYEASAQDQLAIAGAELVIENGGGYDPFVDALLEASGNEDAVVLDASEISGLVPEGAEAEGHDHEDGEEHDHEEADEEVHEDEHGHEGPSHIEGFNEHVWYSFEAVDALAHELAHELGHLDEASAAVFEENYEAFAAELAALEERAHGLHERWEGTGIAITEPVPLYLLAELGLDNLTPAEFSEAIEEGTDVPPLVLQELLGLVADGQVALLAYNEQTAGPETEQLRAAAEQAGVPVVSFTETLPDGADYLSWMADNISAVEAALG